MRENKIMHLELNITKNAKYDKIKCMYYESIKRGTTFLVIIRQ